MIKKVAAIAASTMLALTVSAGTASARSSAPAGIQDWDNCKHGQACLWQGMNGLGGMEPVPWCNRVYNLSTLSNRVSALWNRTGGALDLWDGFDGTGEFLGSYPAYGLPVNVPVWINDRTSSVVGHC
ncbi:peptidase inhibitor family I36 protein [Kitasatospora aburaviensis]|uniref:Peptidase inhibitor family I36 protein n=1 Tax=Kitasatospora aburaviensis TaxID=67265 RepID=A0ABW1F900_9ACTN